MDNPTRWAAFRKSSWFRLTWAVPAFLVFAAIVVIVARIVRDQPGVQEFMTQYPGRTDLPPGAPVGFPAWLQWQHFLNAFFIVFIVRTGWQLRSKKRPAAFWTRKNTGILKTRNPPVRIGLPLWLHLGIDILWVANGVLFYVLVFATGQWMRLVPTTWELVPNAVSVGIQYASLYWPVDDGWVNYNALQQLSYFATVFIAAPLALATGIRMVPGLAARFRWLDRVFPLRVARTTHFIVMLYFVAFVIAHVTLVLSTGALRNLNHMYAGRDDETWWGFGIFALAVVVMAIAWVLATPRRLADLAEHTGTVRR